MIVISRLRKSKVSVIFQLLFNYKLLGTKSLNISIKQNRRHMFPNYHRNMIKLYIDVLEHGEIRTREVA